MNAILRQRVASRQAAQAAGERYISIQIEQDTQYLKNNSMKKTILFLFVVILFLYSCGGVIGNIEKYRFTYVSMDSLKNAVNRVYIKHPEFKDFDTTKFKQGQSLGDGNYYCKIRDKKYEYFFKYSYPQYPHPNDTIVEIALTSAAKYGEDLDLAKEIGFFKKRKYQKLFEKYFIEEVKKELK